MAKEQADDDDGIREDIEPELDGAKEEIIDELGRLHGAMSVLSEERQALQSQMAGPDAMHHIPGPSYLRQRISCL